MPTGWLAAQRLLDCSCMNLSALQEPGMYQKVKDTVNTVLHGDSAEQAKQYAASK